ncbi:MAG TPA: protein-glutamate O-methyltransferase CheR [Spirochaetota bacterium]|jgi:chemotaxis protein methyltransferase CheR|nr:MAG: Chemotaxis protein methyltransferase Cher2 [Spirochaetes bacterium ADurb.Bin133]HNZ26720.1 protein-glutamate O-methyltransferase CheR [Spirochaetota bacterium]HOF01497.1 protein-glutamate O-methyltransferase CheR [Spirochaetota bacterium]HOS33115.1 protein-glutamate O-methyltransferase CheR [Spirochaetota bacterium]HOS56372.1 protein-glutamate O-methyltransferase CheR [Spirochaetota bacterium]
MFEKLENADFKKFRDLIYDSSGIHFTEVNRPILESRLKDRLKKSNLNTLGEYYNILISQPQELKVLLDAVTTNLTSFFRNAVQFHALENEVINQLMASKDEKVIKVWSAGCSTGEEPYSIAMSLKEKLDRSWRIEIIASDISFNVLMKAKEGFYPDNKIAGIPPAYLNKYFVKTGGGYHIIDDIRKIVTFDYHNLKYDSGLRNFDVVFCRNVIIYFDSKAQMEVINRIYESMNPNSYLFIGHSESLFGMNTKFSFVKLGEACLYMKK